MAGEFKGLTIKFRGDASDLSKALATINGEMRATSRAGRDVERILSMRGATGNVDLLGQRVRIAGDRCREWQDRVDALKAAQDSMGDRTEENAQQYDRLTDEIQRAQAQLEAYTQQLREAEVAYDKGATKLGQLGGRLRDAGEGMQAIGGRMQAAGDALTRTVTAPLVAFGAVSIRSATEVDDALTGVRKTLDATEDQYARLRDAAIESSKQQPVDAATILNIEALGAQLGFGIDELQEFSRVASGLDVATNMNWEDAATNMAQFANIMQMSHEDVSRYGSTIVDLGNHFATTESDVSDMGMRIAAAGKQLGMSEADVLGLSAALTSMGVNAEAGGTAISSIMSGIDKDVATGSENLKLWADTAGMSADEFAKAWGDRPVDALARVLSGLDEATENGDSMAVMLDELGISSLRQTDVMKRLAGNTDLMTDAVGRANAAWGENIALQAEVDNRNDSISSKLQVAANKLQAIAIEVGGPLADALIDAIDAAEPLIQKVGDMAKAFADMDEAQQGNIIKLGLMAAAAGPLLSVLGRLTSGFGGMLDRLGKSAETFAAFRGQLKNGKGVVDAFKTAVKGGGTALAGLKVMGVVAGVAALAGVVALATKRWRDIRKETRNFDDAMSGMRANTEGLGRAFTIGSDGVKRMGDTARDARSDVEGLIDSIRQHNDRNAETRASAETSIGMLQQYRDVIDRLAGAGSASSEDMALLEWALKGIEEQTGKTYDASDVLAGKFQDEAGETHNLRDEIDKLIDAKKREAEASALQDMLTDTTEQRMKAEKELGKVTEELNDHMSNFMKANKDTINPMTHAKYTQEELIDRMKKSDTTYQDLARRQLEAKQAVEGLTDEEQTYLNMLGDLAEAERKWGDREGIIMTTERMREACEKYGISAKSLAEGMEAAGVSTEQFAQIGGDQFAMMAEMAGGDMDTLIGLIEDYNATEFQSKYGDLHVDGVGNVVDAQGVIYEWNGTEFVPKFLQVDTNAGEVKGEVDELASSTQQVESKDATVNATTSGKNLVDDLHTAIDLTPKDTQVAMTANVNRGGVDDLLSTLASANGNEYSVTFTTYNRTVNEVINKTSSGGPVARGGIIRNHATGDILMANRRGPGVMYDSYNRIGEQGAEAIVPLQHPFADQFASIIADSMAKQGGAGCVINSYYVNDAIVNGDAEIQAAFLTLFDTLIRKGAMNVG